MERHDFDAFGQVVAVAIEQGIRDGLASQPQPKDDRAEKIEHAAKSLINAIWKYRPNDTFHTMIEVAIADLRTALERK